MDKTRLKINICGIIIKITKDNVQHKSIVKIFKNITLRIIVKIHRTKLYISALINVKTMFGK